LFVLYVASHVTSVQLGGLVMGCCSPSVFVTLEKWSSSILERSQTEFPVVPYVKVLDMARRQKIRIEAEEINFMMALYT
jgi:hypothetical protein